MLVSDRGRRKPVKRGGTTRIFVLDKHGLSRVFYAADKLDDRQDITLNQLMKRSGLK